MSTLSSDMRIPPPPPTRSSSNGPKVTFKGAQTWKESIGMVYVFLMAFVVLITLLCLTFYLYKDRQLYEELVDYLDKTISISKINFNARLGYYSMNDRELDALSSHRSYKTLLWCNVAAELIALGFLGMSALVYIAMNVSQGTPRIVFWATLAIGLVYILIESHLFFFMYMPHTSQLPNTTELLLNHAIPHNPGGLQQMEQRLGCTFDYNLYATRRRRENPMNTCDPQVESSFLPRWLLIALLALHFIVILFTVLMLVKRTPFSESLAQLVEKLKGNDKKQRLYVQKASSGNVPAAIEKKTTTFGANGSRNATPLPPIPSPMAVDHAVSYNNTAYFSNPNGLNSSRSSEISRIDTHDLFRSPHLHHHASGSLQSEV